MTMRDIEETITKLLKKHYNEGGKKDFSFKVKKLPLSFDNRIIGKVLGGNIASKGMVEKVSTTTWKTCFNGGP